MGHTHSTSLRTNSPRCPICSSARPSDLFAPAHSPFTLPVHVAASPPQAGSIVLKRLIICLRRLGQAPLQPPGVLTISAKMRRRPTKKWDTSEMCPYLFRFGALGAQAPPHPSTLPLKNS